MGKPRSSGLSIQSGVLPLCWLFLLIPLSISAQSLPVTDGVVLHLVADDIVATLNGTVTTWSDSAGGALTATQTTEARQPALVENALNGRRVVRFDGVDDRLTLSSNLFSSSSFPKTVFAVVRSTDINGHIIGTGSSSNGFLPSYGSALVLVGGKAFLKANNASTGLDLMTIETLSAGMPQIVMGTMVDGTSRLETVCSVNQSDESLSAFGYVTTTLGATGNAIDPLEGDIAEIIVYNRALTDNEISSLQTYLATRYGIALASRVDTDGNGIFDSCDDGGVYLKDPDISVSLVSPESLTGGVIGNAIDAEDPLSFDVHTQVTHVYVSSGPVELRFDLQTDYDLDKLHFWNYTNSEGDFDVDNVDFRFLDSENNPVGQIVFSPQLGASPIYAEDVLLENIRNVRYVEATLTGTNGQVDFQNIGFTGRQSDTLLIFRDGFENVFGN